MHPAAGGPEGGARAAGVGRAGSGEDAKLFLAVLRDGRRSAVEHEAAAIGLGTLPRIDDAELRKSVRDFYGDLLKKRAPLG